ncbi:Fibronectin type-III domain-containing protein [Schistosoma japonicum]|nr:Fibronectin type-III domain-containing protein [Schistosoma japonicum]
MFHDNCQMMILKNDNCMSSKLEHNNTATTYGESCLRPYSYSFNVQTAFTNMNTGSLQNDTIVENSNTNVCAIPTGNLRNSEFPQTLNPYHQSFQSSNSVQDFSASTVSQTVFPSPIPTVIAAAAATAGVNSTTLPLPPLLFHPHGSYILPNPSSTNLPTTHLQHVNPQISNMSLNNDYKTISPSNILETTTHSSLPFIASSIDGTLTNSTTNSNSQSSCTTNKESNENGNYYVMVHVDAGETFSVRVGDQIQHIPGPATVRMVSNSGPPLPMPMQVPPGHLVQQIVDEEGILTHVILSPYPTPPPLAMVATGVPLPINQTNDVSTTAANLILNPNQHLQPPHLHPHHHHHFHPILISPGLPPNSESLLHLNPYTTPQHPQSHSSLHSFPHPLPTPLQLIHPHFHQQFHLHTSHPHLCDGSGSTTDGCAPISMKYPIPPEVLNETHDCDTSYKCGSPCLGDSNKSSDSFCHSKQNIVIKEIPDSTTTAVINNNINGDNHPDLIDTQHDNLVSLNDLHSINSGCCNSTESLPVIDSSINDEVAKIKSSKSFILCTSYLPKPVTSCKTSFVTAESKNITDANKCEIRNHISRVEDGQVINGQLSSDYCIPTTTITTATLINNDSISYTTTHIGTQSGLNAFSPYFASYPPATFPFHRRRRGGGVGRGANESGIVSVNPTPGEAGSNKSKICLDVI